MSPSASGRRTSPRGDVQSRLQRLATSYQRQVVIPHCALCRAPCCRLDNLVLELDWTRLRALWGLKISRRAFDEALGRGDGPAEIRSRDGCYYVHRRTCPAFVEGRCSVYDSRLMPTGCRDFPVCEEDGRILADRRCEAVVLADIEARVRKEFGAGALVRWQMDKDFPFLARLSIGKRRIEKRGRAVRRRASVCRA